MKRTVLVSAAVVMSLTGCTSCTPRPLPERPEITYGVKENNVPGTVDHTWTEPMYDTVRVPGQLDPTGTYYRPSHNTVVEIRPERHQEVQYPDSNGGKSDVNGRSNGN